MLWSSVMRSSYRSVVRSWTSSCSLMRWDCSHWDQENKTEVPVSWRTYGWVIVSFMVPSHHNLNMEHAPNKHMPSDWLGIPEATIAADFYHVFCLCSIHLSLGEVPLPLLTILGGIIQVFCSPLPPPKKWASGLSWIHRIPSFGNVNLQWMDLGLCGVDSFDWGSWKDCPLVPETYISELPSLPHSFMVLEFPCTLLANVCWGMFQPLFNQIVLASITIFLIWLFICRLNVFLPDYELLQGKD